MPWVGVTERFRRFDEDLLPTSVQIDDAYTKALNVRRCLQSAYYGSETDTPPGFVVGSWGKGTQVRPSGDIDILFPVPASEWGRINGYSGNNQSIFLQEIKNVISQRYSSTDLRGDGQVVQIKFNSIMVEVVPAFSVGDGFEFYMPETRNGGRWKSIWPAFERIAIELSDSGANGNVLKLSRMMKHWKRHKSVNLKSFAIDLLVAKFFDEYKNKLQSYFYYDWFVRDFLKYLILQSNSLLYSPGSDEYINIGSQWLPDAKNALKKAEEACDLEYQDCPTLAGIEWVEMFGGRIPTSV